MIEPREIKLPAFLKGLKRLGFIIDKSPNKHMKATNPKTGNATMIPRHKPVNKMIVRSTFIFLQEQGFSDDEVKEAFKIK